MRFFTTRFALFELFNRFKPLNPFEPLNWLLRLCGEPLVIMIL
jgi:hypothetical protein